MMTMLIDISQEVFSSAVYPGDPVPNSRRLSSIADGALYNLTEMSMCVHNGTHVDAPFHFIESGKTIGEMGLAPFIGNCYVARHTGDMTAEDAAGILAAARAAGAAERILLAGALTVTAAAAQVFADAGILLLGNEGQTVGPADAPMEVHLILLGAEVVLLEGIVLTDVTEGTYMLMAAPLHLAGCDGAPCRAVLMK
ncbi:MAG: cyclase family protein [Oscillospiraceae bacterium]|nr:cyclase family protein [Oscillospiraceae bacterium]